MTMKAKVILIAMILGTTCSALYSQTAGKKDQMIVERELSGFTGIEAGGIVNVFIETADEFLVGIEAEKNLQDKVRTTLDNDLLVISTEKLRNTSRINIYVRMPELKYLKASGATEVTANSLLTGEELKVLASGASTVTLEVDVNYLESYASGAADLIISGKADSHFFDLSGAASLNAKSLETNKAAFNLSGAADASVNVSDKISGAQKGASSVKNYGESDIQLKSGSSVAKNYTSSYSGNSAQKGGDSVKVSIGKISIDVYDSDDSVKVRVGDREVRIDDNGNVRYSRKKRPKFNGHWAGFEMGLNGYVNRDFNMSFPRDIEYLDLRMEKSVVVNVNVFEQNVALAKNQKWGMVTGLGFSWNNYRFTRPTRLEPDSSVLVGFLDQGISIRKSKLTALYFNVPLLMEFQTNNKGTKDSFHFALGMIAGARLSSHTKKYYDEYNKSFNVTLYDPETDTYVTEYSAVSPESPKSKRFDDFHLQPFKFDATARIGWGFINLFATCSVNQMFKKDKGPELYPWSAGITLVNF
jgi:hypothetical protein